MGEPDTPAGCAEANTLTSGGGSVVRRGLLQGATHTPTVMRRPVAGPHENTVALAFLSRRRGRVGAGVVGAGGADAFGVPARGGAQDAAEVLAQVGLVVPAKSQGDVSQVGARVLFELEGGCLQPVAQQHPLGADPDQARKRRCSVRGDHPTDAATSEMCTAGWAAKCLVSAHLQIAAGATLREEVSTFVTGDRFGSIVDPFGQRWAVLTRVEDVSPSEVERRLAGWGPLKASPGERFGQTATPDARTNGPAADSKGAPRDSATPSPSPLKIPRTTGRAVRAPSGTPPGGTAQIPLPETAHQTSPTRHHHRHLLLAVNAPSQGVDLLVPAGGSPSRTGRA